MFAEGQFEHLWESLCESLVRFCGLYCKPEVADQIRQALPLLVPVRYRFTIYGPGHGAHVPGKIILNFVPAHVNLFDGDYPADNDFFPGSSSRILSKNHRPGYKGCLPLRRMRFVPIKDLPGRPQSVEEILSEVTDPLHLTDVRVVKLLFEIPGLLEPTGIMKMMRQSECAFILFPGTLYKIRGLDGDFILACKPGLDGSVEFQTLPVSNRFFLGISGILVVDPT